MPNHIKNRLTLIGPDDQINAMISAFSTFYPSEPNKSYDGKLIHKNKETGAFGWLDPENNEFTRRDEDVTIGVPDGFVQDFTDEWTRFPDFSKVIPPPDDPAYNDEPNQDIARQSPNWWYKWNPANWGTKWNSYSCEKLEDNVFQFETAWNGVPDLIGEMHSQFPDVDVTYEYSDEDTGYNCGIYVFSKEGLVSESILKGGSKEAYDLALKLRPEYNEYYELVNGEWRSKED